MQHRSRSACNFLEGPGGARRLTVAWRMERRASHPGVKGCFEPDSGSGRKLASPVPGSQMPIAASPALGPTVADGVARRLGISINGVADEFWSRWGASGPWIRTRALSRRAGRSDADEEDFHSATVSNRTFFLQVIAEDRAWYDRPRRLSSVVGLRVSMVASRPELIRGAGV